MGHRLLRPWVQRVGHSVVSNCRTIKEEIVCCCPAAGVSVSHGVVVSVFTWHTLFASPVFCSSRRGALFPSGAAAVVWSPEADHGPSPSAFAARTCTRYAVFAFRPLIVSCVAVPGSGRPPVAATSDTQSSASVGSVLPA